MRATVALGVNDQVVSSVGEREAEGALTVCVCLTIHFVANRRAEDRFARGFIQHAPDDGLGLFGVTQLLGIDAPTQTQRE